MEEGELEDAVHGLDYGLDYGSSGYSFLWLLSVRAHSEGFDELGREDY